MEKLSFTLWVTEACNLGCSYCYVEKKPIIMSSDVLDHSLNFIKDTAENLANSCTRILIDFHGGEPLLNFQVIKKVVVELKSYFSNIYFRLTTNGTIMDEMIYDFLREENFGITISIDGTQKYHDLNRRFISGEGSFDKVIESLDYFKRKKYPIRMRMTVDVNTVAFFSKNFIYLYEQNEGAIAYALNDDMKKWDKDSLYIFEVELRKVIDYLMIRDEEYAKVYLDAIKKEYLRFRSKCSGGTESFHIDGKGEVYPCIRAVGRDEFIIGSVEAGIDQKKYIQLDRINSEEAESCKKCNAANMCTGNVCKIINKIDTGDYYTPSGVSCILMRVYIKLIKEYSRG